jgi:hypothetical protein
MQEFKKAVIDSGTNILNEVEKTSRENNNLVEWLKIYDRQIKEMTATTISHQPQHQSQA